MSLVFLCFLRTAEHSIFISFTRFQKLKNCLQYYICGKPAVVVIKFIFLKNIPINTFGLITFCVFKTLFKCFKFRMNLDQLVFKLLTLGITKGLFLILWFYLKTFKNLYCHGSVFQFNYFPYFHQQIYFFAEIVVIADPKVDCCLALFMSLSSHCDREVQVSIIS